MEQALFSSPASIPTVFASHRASANVGASAKAPWHFDEREASAAASTVLNTPSASAPDTSRAVLDHVHFGVTVVGQEFELLFANSAASRECSRHPCLLYTSPSPRD